MAQAISVKLLLAGEALRRGLIGHLKKGCARFARLRARVCQFEKSEGSRKKHREREALRAGFYVVAKATTP
jgi:hypothetical protein